jgi:hypothetical protein
VGTEDCARAMGAVKRAARKKVAVTANRRRIEVSVKTAMSLNEPGRGFNKYLYREGLGLPEG